MGRIRSIKPEFFTNEGLSALDAETHLFAAGLLCYADDEGYFNANPKLTAAAIFPLREVSGKIPEMYRSLHAIGYLALGSSADGKHWGRILKFDTHQGVSHPTPSKIKGLQITWDEFRNPPENFGNPPELFRPEQGTGNREQGTKPSRAKREHPTKTEVAKTRHSEFKEAIREYWTAKNEGIDMPWGPAEGKQLEMWLRESPLITLEQFKGFLRNRYKSQVNHGERPSQWVRYATSYANGPLDKFGKPLALKQSVSPKPRILPRPEIQA